MKKAADKKYEIMEQVMDALEGILCSYQGRGHHSVFIDLDSFKLLSSLVVDGQIKVENYRYSYDINIYEDEEAVKIYKELAPQTRWRMGCHTQIEPIRMNALLQFSSMGMPVYKGHIYYPETETVLECGEILPYEIFQLFTDMPEVKKLYVFPYPFRKEGEKPVYFSFEPTKEAREEMRKYVEKKFEEMCRIARKIEIPGVVPEIN